MKCPHCGAWSEVHDTRPAPHSVIRRRRACANGHKFLTMEVHPQVVKAAGRNVDATGRVIAANAKRWARDAAIARDPRPPAHVASEYGITGERVRQIRAANRVKGLFAQQEKRTKSAT